MSQPLIATGRILVTYLVDGLTHVAHAYVRNIQSGGSTYQINTRALDENDLDWEDAAQGLADALSCFMASATSFGTAILQQLSSGVWNPISTTTVTNANGGSTYQAATQATFVYRDTAFKKLKVVVLEGNAAAPFHTISPTGGGTGYDTGIAMYLAGAATEKPYNWQVSRGNRYLAASGTFVGATIALNRKVRRARGLT